METVAGMQPEARAALEETQCRFCKGVGGFPIGRHPAKEYGDTTCRQCNGHGIVYRKKRA